MLVILVQWIVTLVLAYTSAVLTLHALDHKGQHALSATISIPIRLLLGLGLLGAWAVFLSLFFPLGAIAFLLTCLILGIGAVIQRKVMSGTVRADWVEIRGNHPLILLAGMALFLICLFWSAGVPENYDTGLYHAQAIRWLEEYGTVTGLGNLIAQLGYNSLLFPLAAFSSFSFLELSTSHAVNGLLFALFGSFLLGRIAGLFRGRINVGILCSFILLYLSRRIYIRELSSPSTDLPAAIFTWLAVLLFLEVLENWDEDQQDQHIVMIVLAALFAIMFKLSTLPVIILPLYLIVKYTRKQGLGRLVLLSFAMLIPWEIRGLLLSGLPLYPSKALDVFNFKWEIPQASVDNQLFWMRYYVRNESQDPVTNQAIAFGEWFPVWWQRLGLIDQVLIMGALATAVGLLIYGIVRVILKRTRGRNSGMLVFALSLVLLMMFWFLGAPMIRYGYGALIILFSVGVGFLMFIVLKPRIKWLPYLAYALTGVILVYQLYGVYKIARSDLLEQYLVRAADYRRSELVIRSLGDFTVYMPAGEVYYDWCWDAPLPCTPVHDPWVKLRGEGLGDGFYNSAPKD
jgi:hypothetical protein